MHTFFQFQFHFLNFSFILIAQIAVPKKCVHCKNEMNLVRDRYEICVEQYLHVGFGKYGKYVYRNSALWQDYGMVLIESNGFQFNKI